MNSITAPGKEFSQWEIKWWSSLEEKGTAQKSILDDYAEGNIHTTDMPSDISMCLSGRLRDYILDDRTGQKHNLL